MAGRAVSHSISSTVTQFSFSQNVARMVVASGPQFDRRWQANEAERIANYEINHQNSHVERGVLYANSVPRSSLIHYGSDGTPAHYRILRHMKFGLGAD